MAMNKVYDHLSHNSCNICKYIKYTKCKLEKLSGSGFGGLGKVECSFIAIWLGLVVPVRIPSSRDQIEQFNHLLKTI